MATAGGLAVTAVHFHHVRSTEWGLLAFSGLVAMAGVGLARRSIVSQVLSRGTAWVVLVPSAIATLVTTLGGHAPDMLAAGLTAGSGAALLLARPMLHTKEARAAFAPSWFRRWLLAASTSSIMAGVVTGIFALDGLRGHTAPAIALLALSLSLVMSALGVVRMRAWGILLGALTSFVTLIASAAMHDVAGLVLSLAAIPGLMLTLPVLLAKRDRAKGEARARVATSFAALEPRIRVASVPDEVEAAAFDEAPEARRASVQA
ncbi:MAG: hypothetical protein KF819_11755 [Labilithrix sp.]|nr:hypothetical protein [Labilithrix sp.]